MNRISSRGNKFHLSSTLMAQMLFISGMLFGLLWTSQAQAASANLGKILHQVEKQAPALKAAYANIDVFKAKRNIVRSRFLGNIDLYAHDLHFNDNRLTRPISPPINFANMTSDDNQIGYGASIQLPLDINGQIRNSFHAMTHQTKAVQAEAAYTRLSLLYNAAGLYRSLEQIIGQRETLQKQAEALQGHINVAITAIEIGRVAPVEKLRLVAELKAVEGRLAGLDGVEAGLRARLAALLESQSFTDSISSPVQQPSPIMTNIVSILDRPDIQVASEREQAAHYGVKAAWGAFFPQIFAVANWQQNQGYDGSGRDDATWQVTIQARLPLWNGGRRRSEIAQAKAQRRAARYQVRAIKEKANAELIAAKGAWAAAKAQYGAAQSTVEATEEVTRIQTDRFDQGRLSATDLVDAEASLASARSELTTSLVRWWRADDALRLALGLPPAAYAEEQSTTVD